MSAIASTRARVRVRARARRSLCLVAALVWSAGCEHPIAVVTPHIEAADLVLHLDGDSATARTALNRSWSVDTLVLRDGTAHRVVLRPLDFRGQAIELSGRADLSFRLEAEDAALLQWEPQRGFGYLRPFAAGRTRVRFLIWHETHADFVTPWLPVRVESRATSTAVPDIPSSP